jgi:DNA-directed RNA polymerase specialized sigma54-like protein
MQSDVLSYLFQREGTPVEQGSDLPNPLSIAEAAVSIEIDQEILRTAVTNKYVQTPGGVFALHEFFVPE